MLCRQIRTRIWYHWLSSQSPSSMVRGESGYVAAVGCRAVISSLNRDREPRLSSSHRKIGSPQAFRKPGKGKSRLREMKGKEGWSVH